MVIVLLRVEVPDEHAAAYFLRATRDWCEEHDGWRLLSDDGAAVAPSCAECGAPMVFEPALQEYVCHHPD